ncbi:MAG: hypothetical protein AB8G15_19350 [Saprospiraceae bacterium]
MTNQRNQFIERLFAQLTGSAYVLLKYTEKSLSEIAATSDLDILLPNRNLALIQDFVTQEASVNHWNMHRQHSMTQLFIHFSDGGFLQIDCLYYLVRKDLIYLSNDYLLAAQRQVGTITTYSDFCLLEHLVLFHQLNFAGIPAKYLVYFESFAPEKIQRLLEQFQEKYNYSIFTLREFSAFDTALRMHLVEYLKALPENKWADKQINTVKYVLDVFRTIKWRRGFLISFTGVDGAGKSTILEATRRLLSKKFRRKTVVLRHRPSLLPILSSFVHGKAAAEKRSAARLPRQGNNTSKFKSLLRFSYYYLDYLLGRSYVFFRYQLFNYIVLYDRYYFDFIVDPKRTNLTMDAVLPKSLYRFVQKPVLNFFLYAPTEIILSRKQELTEEAVETLTRNYQTLFKEFSEDYPQKYIAVKNIIQADTMQQITHQIAKLI